MASHQRNFLQSQISRRIRELVLDDYDEYYQQIINGIHGLIEWSVLVDRLVVKETSFFRHSDSLKFVGHIVQLKVKSKKQKDSLEIWSLGCATGEEAYSLAMTVNDCFDLIGSEPQHGITAIDIRQTALRTARNGVYSARKVDAVSPARRARYFQPVEGNSFQVVPWLRDRVCFAKGNLLKIAELPKTDMDIIYCQNVLIYFRRWRRREIMNSLAERLKVGGVVIAGLGEVVEWSHPNFKRVSDERVQAYIRYQ